MPEPERIDRHHAALIAYDVCLCALTPSYPARRAAMGPVLEGWVQMIAVAREGGGAGHLHDAGQPRRWRRCRHAADRPFGGDRRASTHQRYRGYPQRLASPTKSRRGPRITFSSSACRVPFTGTALFSFCTCCDAIRLSYPAVLQIAASRRSVREAFNLDLASIVVRECCWSSDAAAHAYSLDKAMKMYARIRSLDQVAAMLRD